ncbi:MAG TPA: glycosyltransferase [Planctomycetota bacterium]
MRQKICIISFSPVSRDARVLRQIQYLSPHFDLSVVGFGDPLPASATSGNVQWHPVGPKPRALHRRLLTRGSLIAGRLAPELYSWRYWQMNYHREALERALAFKAHLYLADDLTALPVAAEAARRAGAKLAFDAHEYSPLEAEELWWWRMLFRPMVLHFLQTYARQVDLCLTVCSPIAERYRQEFGLDAKVILSAPAGRPASTQAREHGRVRLIHHGGAMRGRKPELMIDAIALCDPRIDLTFMLVPSAASPGFVDELQAYAARRAPGRITFRQPVPPAEIVESIAQFDMGLFLIPPVNYNWEVCLPNKFFDFITAGLAVCVGPSPAMAELIKKYGCGCVSPTFDAADMARTLNALTPEMLASQQAASRQAALELNAEVEMRKLIEYIRATLGS